jgi:hypothetical protein
VSTPAASRFDVVREPDPVHSMMGAPDEPIDLNSTRALHAPAASSENRKSASALQQTHSGGKGRGVIVPLLDVAESTPKKLITLHSGLSFDIGDSCPTSRRTTADRRREPQIP